jgi:hypothetical protein
MLKCFVRNSVDGMKQSNKLLPLGFVMLNKGYVFSIDRKEEQEHKKCAFINNMGYCHWIFHYCLHAAVDARSKYKNLNYSRDKKTHSPLIEVLFFY